MKNNKFDMDIIVCKNLFWALMLLASGVKCLGMLTSIMTAIGYGLITISVTYIVFMIVMVFVIESRS